MAELSKTIWRRCAFDARGARRPARGTAGLMVGPAAARSPAVGGGGWYWTTREQAVAVKVGAGRRRSGRPARGRGGAERLRLRDGAAPRDGVVEGHRQGDRGPRRGRAAGQGRPGPGAAGRYAAARRAGAGGGAAGLRAQGGARRTRSGSQQAELTLGRRQQLLKEGVVGKAEVDEAQANVDSLKARIAYAHAADRRGREPGQPAEDRPRPTWSSARRSAASRSRRTRSRAR